MNFNIIGATIFFAMATILSFIGPFLDGSDKAIVFVSVIILLIEGWLCIVFNRLEK